MIEADRKMEAALLLGIFLTIILYFLIPATCPGFPRPVVNHIYYSNETTPDGNRFFSISGMIENQGTRGTVIVTTALVNTTNRTSLTSTSTTFFMMPGEKKTVTASLTGRTNEPCEIRVTAKRR